MESHTVNQTGGDRLPLDGIRIIDLTRVTAGPYCALLLGELGAEAIKIEKPGRGDHSRRPRGEVPDLRYLVVNLNRKSVTLDTWMDEGRAVFKDLVRHADVVLENFRPGVMKRMGFDYDMLRSIKPGIILTSISGWGQNNSLSHYTAHNSVITAFTGVQYMNRFDGGPPTSVPGSMADCGGGVYAAIGTLAALFERQATGVGRHVDISMADTIIGQIAYSLLFVLLTGKSPPERGMRSADGASHTAFHEVYEASDGWVYLQADLQAQWTRLAEAMGRPDLLTDPRFMTEPARADNKAELDTIFKGWLKGRTKEEVFRLLGGAGVPCSPANSLIDVANHPYLRERGILQEIEDPRLGKTPVISPRIQFAGEKPRTPRPAPFLGEHNDEIFGDVLGYDKAKIEALRQQGVI